MRTLVVSDLHLGAARGRDALRRPGPLAALTQAVRGADRLVLLGDALELRHGPVRDALVVAVPVFRALGEALGPEGELVLLPGNHDHALLAPWLEGRGGPVAPPPLGLAEAAGSAPTRLLAPLAAAAAPARFSVAYPGVWLRPDVYATHGHYLDRLITVPTFERLAAAGMARIVGALPPEGATPDDFEAALAPLYAWMHAVAQSKEPGFTVARQTTSTKTWQALAGDGPRTLRDRALGVAFPVAVAGLNRLGLGPVRPQLSGPHLRSAGLQAMGEVVRLLGVEAEHVVFGHTHRAGPLPGDDLG
ncbi:MAG: hypothetical protein JWO90_1285, partial [Solirubrobacterales bacterium]|nr:hypothetical protein [Solirubrobacterales bacterium]